MRLYIGTYTNGGNFFLGSCGKGIMSCQFDTESGVFSALQQFSDVPNPSWLHIADDETYLFAVSELFVEPGKVHGFEIQSSGSLTHVSTQSSEGLATCHLQATANHLYAASYLDGRLSTYSRDKADISAPSDVIIYEGSGPNEERQEAAHLHQVQLSPDKKWLYVCDLGSDCIRLHEMHDGVAVHVRDIEVAAGAGPRHLVFHPTQPLAWAVCELLPRIIAFQWDEPCGDLTEIQTFDLADYPDLEGGGAPAALRLHPSNKLLGISDRGGHSLCLCSIAESGELTFQQRIKNEGRTPRDFNFTPEGRWLIAAYQESHGLSSYAIDRSLIVNAEPVDELEVSSPVCVAFTSR